MGILSTINENLIPIILFLTVISMFLLPLAFIAFLIFYADYSKKIDLTINVDQKTFYNGEKIRGNMKVLLKKDLPIKKLTISLLCRNSDTPSSQAYIYYKKEHHIEDTFSVGITKSIPFEFYHPYDITEEFTEQSSWKRRLFRRSSGPIYFKGPKWFNPKVWVIRANAESTKIIRVTKEIAINIETDSNPDMMK